MNGNSLKNATSLRWLACFMLAASLAACSSGPKTSARPDVLAQIQPSGKPLSYASLNGEAIASANRRIRLRPMANLPKPLLAEIVIPKRPLQCVPYARALSDIQIRGNAWTWWAQAEGRYPRSGRPKAGAVIVLKRKGANSLGHIAYVDEVIDNRMLIVSHANWLNKGRLHNRTPVIDVSTANDWSAVRFWNTEGGHFGGNTYYPYGFIHQHQTIAAR